MPRCGIVIKGIVERGREKGIVLSGIRGLNRSVIYAWMNGSKTPRIDSLKTFCDYYGENPVDVYEDIINEDKGDTENE